MNVENGLVWQPLMMSSRIRDSRSSLAIRQRWTRKGAVGLLLLLVAFAALMLARRWAGALVLPLHPAALLLAGAIVAAAAVGVRLGWFLAPEWRARRASDTIVMALALAAVVASSVGLAVIGTDPVAKLVLFLLLASEEGWAWAWYFDRSAARRKAAWSLERAHDEDGDSGDHVLPKEVVQQLVRSQADDGSECLAGWLRVPFAPGQRTGNVHVAFCPPLVATPELSLEQLDGPEARIKTAQVLPYGARLELKLAAAAEESSDVVLQFSARTAKP